MRRTLVTPRETSSVYSLMRMCARNVVRYRVRTSDGVLWSENVIDTDEAGTSVPIPLSLPCNGGVTRSDQPHARFTVCTCTTRIAPTVSLPPRPLPPPPLPPPSFRPRALDVFCHITRAVGCCRLCNYCPHMFRRHNWEENHALPSFSPTSSYGQSPARVIVIGRNFSSA